MSIAIASAQKSDIPFRVDQEVWCSTKYGRQMAPHGPILSLAVIKVLSYSN